MLKRALTNTPKLDNNIIAVWKISWNFHICSHQIFGDHCKKESQTGNKHKKKG